MTKMNQKIKQVKKSFYKQAMGVFVYGNEGYSLNLNKKHVGTLPTDNELITEEFVNRLMLIEECWKDLGFETATEFESFVYEHKLDEYFTHVLKNASLCGLILQGYVADKKQLDKIKLTHECYL